MLIPMPTSVRALPAAGSSPPIAIRPAQIHLLVRLTDPPSPCPAQLPVAMPIAAVAVAVVERKCRSRRPIIIAVRRCRLIRRIRNRDTTREPEGRDDTDDQAFHVHLLFDA